MLKSLHAILCYSAAFKEELLFSSFGSPSVDAAVFGREDDRRIHSIYMQCLRSCDIVNAFKTHEYVYSIVKM